MMQWIERQEDLTAALAQHEDYLVLVFWGGFSDAAQRVLTELKQFARDYKDIPLYILDVQKVKGVHKQYGSEINSRPLAKRMRLRQS